MFSASFISSNYAPFSAILSRYPRLTTFISTFTFFFISLIIVSGILITSLRSNPSSALPLSSDDSGRSDFEDGHSSSGAYPTVKRLSKRRSRKQDSDSGSSASEDESKHNSELGNGVRLSGLRKRRSNVAVNVALESLDTSQRPSLVKNEVNIHILLNFIVCLRD